MQGSAGFSTSYIYDSLCDVQNFVYLKECHFSQKHPKTGRLVGLLVVVLDVALETVKCLDLIEQVAFAALHFVGSFFSKSFSRKKSLRVIKELPGNALYSLGILAISYIISFYSIYLKLTATSTGAPQLHLKKEEMRSSNYTQ